MNITNERRSRFTPGRSKVAAVVLAALTSTTLFAQQQVDTVATNGKILTVDKDFRVVEALAINDGRIVARGPSAEVARYAGSNTKIIDVKAQPSSRASSTTISTLLAPSNAGANRPALKASTPAAKRCRFWRPRPGP